ncbi:MAG: DUF1598 domain-containing protein [Planctomycetota bacterium]
MSPRDSLPIRITAALVVLALALALAPGVRAQGGLGFGSSAVGGISIDPGGMLTSATSDELAKLRLMALEGVGDLPEGLDRATETRKVSLRGLDEAIRHCLETGKPLPAEIEYLGGLQKIRYVMVYPDGRDIVLIGPAEGWKSNDRGVAVGVTTGRPVLLLDDLLVALRAAGGPVRSVISCSIDPTQEGLQRVSAFTKRLRNVGSREAAALGIEQQLGPQAISVTGVPDTSHFARVMVAADYRMKRVSMGHEPSPVRGLTSFLAISGRGVKSMLPRWWLEPDYEPLLRDADGLAWELRGGSVKAMTENDFLDANGVRQQSGKADPASEKWAAMMTDHYDELAQADPVFAQLQDCMDLAIVAALLVHEDLPGKAGVRLPMLTDSGTLEPAKFPAPKKVESKAILAKKGSKWMVACGGVQINPWAMVERAEQTDTLASVRSEAAIQGSADRWWQ